MTNDPKRNKYPTLMTDKHQLSPPRGPKTPKTRESQTETSRHAKASKDPQGSKKKKRYFFGSRNSPVAEHSTSKKNSLENNMTDMHRPQR
jgi:hypothetical protein